MVDNYIYRFLNKINRLDLAERYGLMPFEITTQTIERTLVDKIFALCDYYIQGKTDRHSRHLYDIHKIVETMGLLFVPVSYDTVVQSLHKILDSKLWD